jgi:hypothetical protein
MKGRPQDLVRKREETWCKWGLPILNDFLFSVTVFLKLVNKFVKWSSMRKHN